MFIYIHETVDWLWEVMIGSLWCPNGTILKTGGYRSLGRFPLHRCSKAREKNQALNDCDSLPNHNMHSNAHGGHHGQPLFMKNYLRSERKEAYHIHLMRNPVTSRHDGAPLACPSKFPTRNKASTAMANGQPSVGISSTLPLSYRDLHNFTEKQVLEHVTVF